MKIHATILKFDDGTSLPISKMALKVKVGDVVPLTNGFNRPLVCIGTAEITSLDDKEVRAELRITNDPRIIDLIKNGGKKIYPAVCGIRESTGDVYLEHLALSSSLNADSSIPPVQLEEEQ